MSTVLSVFWERLKTKNRLSYKFSHVLNSRNEFLHRPPPPAPQKSNLGGRILDYILSYYSVIIGICPTYQELKYNRAKNSEV